MQEFIMTCDVCGAKRSIDRTLDGKHPGWMQVQLLDESKPTPVSTLVEVCSTECLTKAREKCEYARKKFDDAVQAAYDKKFPKTMKVPADEIDRSGLIDIAKK